MQKIKNLSSIPYRQSVVLPTHQRQKERVNKVIGSASRSFENSQKAFDELANMPHGYWGISFMKNSNVTLREQLLARNKTFLGLPEIYTKILIDHYGIDDLISIIDSLADILNEDHYPPNDDIQEINRTVNKVHKDIDYDLQVIKHDINRDYAAEEIESSDSDDDPYEEFGLLGKLSSDIISLTLSPMIEPPSEMTLKEKNKNRAERKESLHTQWYNATAQLNNKERLKAFLKICVMESWEVDTLKEVLDQIDKNPTILSDSDEKILLKIIQLKKLHPESHLIESESSVENLLNEIEEEVKYCKRKSFNPAACAMQ